VKGKINKMSIFRQKRITISRTCKLSAIFYLKKQKTRKEITPCYSDERGNSQTRNLTPNNCGSVLRKAQ
jgi:hypothetical protein